MELANHYSIEKRIIITLMLDITPRTRSINGPSLLLCIIGDLPLGVLVSFKNCIFSSYYASIILSLEASVLTNNRFLSRCITDLVVAIATGLGTYRFGLPMTIRSTFYPILGDYCWGWMGDLIDAISLVMTVAGVCTSLGLGAIQMVAGLQRLGWVDPDREDLQMVYVALICIITLCATASVVSGLAVGIKILANIAFGLGCFILFLCFAMEKSRYILDLLFQTTGVYLQWNIFQVPFWTDAFGSLEEGSGRAIDGNSAAEWWIGSWTVFYLAWWVAWACFVGMFIARISRNRTIGNIIVSVFIAPTIYSLLWFCCFGGIGLRQQRQALELEQIGSVSFDDPGHYLAEGSGFCYDVPQDDVIVNGTTVFTNHLLGITPVCTFNRADSTQAWFNVRTLLYCHFINHCAFAFVL